MTGSRRGTEKQIGKLGHAVEDVGRRDDRELGPVVRAGQDPNDDARPGTAARDKVARGVPHDGHCADLVDFEDR